MAITILGSVGFFISLYFVLVHYNLMAPDHALIPRVCRLDEHTCRTILHTHEAHVLGLPNSVYGILFYTACALAAAGGKIGADIIVHQSLLLISLGAVVLSVYLAYALIVRLRTGCVLCFSGHLINIVIFILLASHRPPPRF